MAYLGSRGIFVPRRHVREAFSRADPQGEATQWSMAIKQHVYNVTRPLGLWHFDGNLLVKWHIVGHGCEDGFTPTYLLCSANK